MRTRRGVLSLTGGLAELVLRLDWTRLRVGAGGGTGTSTVHAASKRCPGADCPNVFAERVHALRDQFSEPGPRFFLLRGPSPRVEKIYIFGMSTRTRRATRPQAAASMSQQSEKISALLLCRRSGILGVDIHFCKCLKAW